MIVIFSNYNIIFTVLQATVIDPCPRPNRFLYLNNHIERVNSDTLLITDASVFRHIKLLAISALGKCICTKSISACEGIRGQSALGFKLFRNNSWYKCSWTYEYFGFKWIWNLVHLDV